MRTRGFFAASRNLGFLFIKPFHSLQVDRSPFRDVVGSLLNIVSNKSAGRSDIITVSLVISPGSVSRKLGFLVIHVCPSCLLVLLFFFLSTIYINKEKEAAHQNKKKKTRSICKWIFFFHSNIK